MSNFHPEHRRAEVVSCSGSLVQSRCGDRGVLHTDIAVCGEPSQCSGHTGFAPLSGRVCFPRPHCSGSRLPYMEQALSCVRFQFSGTPQKHRLGCACILCLPCPSSSGSQELDERALPGAVRLLPSTVPASVSSLAGQMRVACVYSWELASSCDPPGGC